MNRFEKAADFGKSMGTAAGALLGAGIGGGGTALYDWIRGNKQNRLRRALIGAGIGGGLGGLGGLVAGSDYDFRAENRAEQQKNKPVSSKITEDDMERAVDLNDVRDEMLKKEWLEHPYSKIWLDPATDAYLDSRRAPADFKDLGKRLTAWGREFSPGPRAGSDGLLRYPKVIFETPKSNYDYGRIVYPK